MRDKSTTFWENEPRGCLKHFGKESTNGLFCSPSVTGSQLIFPKWFSSPAGLHQRQRSPRRNWMLIFNFSVSFCKVWFPVLEVILQGIYSFDRLRPKWQWISNIRSRAFKGMCLPMLPSWNMCQDKDTPTSLLAAQLGLSQQQRYNGKTWKHMMFLYKTLARCCKYIIFFEFHLEALEVDTNTYQNETETEEGACWGYLTFYV